MRLTDCTPKFWTAYGEGREGLGVSFDCPLCVREGRFSLSSEGPFPPMSERTDRTFAVRFAIAFMNPLDGGPAYPNAKHHWQRTGNEIGTLTLSPSVDGSRDDDAKDEHGKTVSKPIDHGGWHGFVENGLIVGGGI